MSTQGGHGFSDLTTDREERGEGPTSEIGLDLVEGGNVDGLDVVLESGDALLKLINRDEFINDDAVDLELLDAVADGDELGSTPEKALHLNGADELLHLDHVGGVVPGLDVEEDVGLANHLLASLLGLSLLLLLLKILLVLLILLIIITEEVDLVFLLLGRGGGSGGSGSGGGSTSGGGETVKRGIS